MNSELSARLDDLLARCVQCGLCLPHCATYLASGSETQSPRGRLVLLGEVVREGTAPDDSVREAFDLCLGCRACETACPSGIDPDLLQAARDLARTDAPPPRILGLRFRPELLPVLHHAGKAGEALAHRLAGPRWRHRLDGGLLAAPARMVGSRPASPDSDDELVGRLDALTGLSTTDWSLPQVPATNSATLFRGCVNGTMLSASQGRLTTLLGAAGVRLQTPDGQTCCGALDAHAGDHVTSSTRRRRNEAALRDSLQSTGTLLVEAAGCGLELGEHILEATVVDAVVLLDGLDLPRRRHLGLRVTYHDPCHARHGQGIIAEPRRLLSAIPGVEGVEPEEADVCCGSGGAYALQHPELSDAMGRRKARRLAATGADLVVTANPGCLGQIRDALAAEGVDLPVLPLTDLLWYACLETESS